jgi:hypothetical protein
VKRQVRARKRKDVIQKKDDQPESRVQPEHPGNPSDMRRSLNGKEKKQQKKNASGPAPE